jgi:hypothetical protein
MSVGNLYTNVLPSHISEEASSVESQRFVVLIETLSNEWTSTSPRTDRVNSSLKWVAVINRCGALPSLFVTELPIVYA